jgi:hypothetical protein
VCCSEALLSVRALQALVSPRNVRLLEEYGNPVGLQFIQGRKRRNSAGYHNCCVTSPFT